MQHKCLFSVFPGSYSIAFYMHSLSCILLPLQWRCICNVYSLYIFDLSNHTQVAGQKAVTASVRVEHLVVCEAVAVYQTH